jgi:hypothetical protein
MVPQALQNLEAAELLCAHRGQATIEPAALPGRDVG